jgi:hypothetical protein
MGHGFLKLLFFEVVNATIIRPQLSDIMVALKYYATLTEKFILRSFHEFEVFEISDSFFLISCGLNF